MRNIIDRPLFMKGQKMKPKLIIFDMDGLMLDTEPLAIAGWKQTATKLGIAIPEEIYPSLIGLSAKTAKTRMLEYMGPDFDFDTALAMLHGYIDNYIDTHGVPLKPGLLYILDKLEENNIRKCVATSTFHDRAVEKLKLAGIAHRFEAIIGGDQVTHSKPAPDIFLKAAGICNTSPAECIVLEDSAAGTQAAFSAGIPVIVIPDLIPPSKTTRDQAYAICENLITACDLICEMPRN